MIKTLAVIPVLNEAAVLEQKVIELHTKMAKVEFPLDIVISDNGSSDNSPWIARKLADTYDNIIYTSVPERGKGNAIKKAWLEPRFDNYDAYCFLDADMATDPKDLPKLISPLASIADIAVGSRYLKSSNTHRTPVRSVLSHGYIIMANTVLGLHLSDYQCGFKAINKRVRDEIVPLCRYGDFFFDTEFLTIANSKGYRITQIPVKWNENLMKSEVNYKIEIPKFVLGVGNLRYRQMINGFNS